MLNLTKTGSGFAIALDGATVMAHSNTRPFAFAGRGNELVDMYRGNFSIEDRIYERVALSEFSIDDAGEALRIRLFRDDLFAMELSLTEVSADSM
ncbi:hypothetical protein MASR2M48_22230 [Spirochaetota bacterium]